MDIPSIHMQSLSTEQRTQQTQKLQAPQAAEWEKTEGGFASAPVTPNYDQYSPEQINPSAGLYRVNHDGQGKPVLQFNDPDKARDQARTKPFSSQAPIESCTTNTDRVDREIQRLKKQQQSLQQQINNASPQQAEHLQRQLDQITRELQQKDHDNYRRQKAVIS